MPPSVRWRSDFDKFVITANCERRGWQKWNPDDSGEEWNFYWANVHTVKQIFLPENGIRLEPWQLINHFPNHYELTRKDLMVKNLKRYQKSMRKEGVEAASLDFVPVTYLLPQDYSLFVEEFRKHPNTTWIMKPTSRSQGKGIFLFNKLGQVKKWAAGQMPASGKAAENYVVSRYIDDPLLIGGKKFDLRLYAVVCSYRPLKVYLSTLGFARFCNEKYSNEIHDIDNMYVHLTNVAIQKHGEAYNEKHGNKWPLENLKTYIAGIHGSGVCRRLWSEIENVVISSLKACQNVMINDRHCFELYGFDIIIDSNLKPWLIEVNASPSLTASTRADRLLKTKVIHDTLMAVCPRQWLQPGFNPSGKKELSAPASGRVDEDNPASTPPRVGSLRLIHDETMDIEAQRVKRDEALASAANRRARNRAVNVL